jgi:hypothetical protein
MLPTLPSEPCHKGKDNHNRDQVKDAEAQCPMIAKASTDSGRCALEGNEFACSDFSRCRRIDYAGALGRHNLMVPLRSLQLT